MIALRKRGGVTKMPVLDVPVNTQMTTRHDVTPYRLYKRAILSSTNYR